MKYRKNTSPAQPLTSDCLRISAQIRIGDLRVEREFAGADAHALVRLIESGQRGLPEHRLSFASQLALRARGVKLLHVRDVGAEDVGRRIALADPQQVQIVDANERKAA